MKRREFIQASALATAGMLSIPSMVNAAASKKIGIQLYTLKDVIGNDPKGILKQLASFGYKELETYGYKEGKLYGLSNAEFGQTVKDLGMKVISGHYGIDIIQSDLDRAIADAKALGQEYIVVPWLGESYRTLDGIKGVCETINKAGETCKKSGIRMGYHNHDFEFKEIDGKVLYDVMLDELDPKLVSMELDLYWVIFAGYDPLKYFAKYPGRFEQWHVKDRDKEVPNRNTEVGSGSIDFRPIFAKAKQSGMKHFYVEQEFFARPSIESARICIDNLKKIL
ncbi:MAG TPA: sugar phosphate isomerase/epimerase [Cyclobacteriaceae bacterium]|nr:sugar phosphate isomerase/epimerase [Cyclobacteriaceae bacterium]